MTQDYSLNELFKVGITREQFISEYTRLCSEKSGKDSSIFGTEMSNAIAQIFDTINTEGNDDKINESELSKLKALSTEDGTDVLSEADLKVLYEQIGNNIKESVKAPEAMYKDAMAQVGSPQESDIVEEISNKISILNELISAREENSNDIIKNYQSQIDDIVQKALAEKTKEDKDFKDKYKAKSDEIKKLQKEAEENTKSLQEAEENKRDALTEIDVIKRENELLDPEKDNDRIEANKNDMKSLQAKLKIYEEDISNYQDNKVSLDSKIAKLSGDLGKMTNSVAEKLENINKEQSDKVKVLKAKIEAEKESSKKDIKQYKETIKSLEESKKYAISQMQQASYSGDASSFHINDGKYNFGDVKYSSAKGQKLAQYMASHAHGFTGHCARAVRLGLQGTGLGTEGAQSAWMMADKLRNNKNYKEIKVSSKEELKSLPAGCIVVYGAGARDVDTGKSYNAKHGHIEVTLGNGTAASDGITRNQRFTQNMTVFVPVD